MAEVVEGGRPPKKRSGAARRAKRTAAKPDGMALARAAQARLDAQLAAQEPLPAGPAAPLVFSNVPAQTPRPVRQRPRSVTVQEEPARSTTPAEPAAPTRILSSGDRFLRRQQWTLADARRLLAQDYSLEQVEWMTGYSAAEVGM
jgi:hypothetical protein